WCCRGLLGECRCQDEATMQCPACWHCTDHCQCTRQEVPMIDRGVGPEAPTTVNDKGGRQSASPYRCDLLPPDAVLAVAKVLKYGADKFGPDNWRKIPCADHLNHALAHVFAYGAGDTSDDHLAHAACRLLFALETENVPETEKGE